jgi:hypothetical protein
VGITRRQVLAATAALSVAGVAATGSAGFQWWNRPPGRGNRHLTDQEHAFVQALSEAWMPPGGVPAISGAEARLGDFLDEVLSGVEPTVARQLRLLLTGLDLLAVSSHGGAYRGLDLATRIEVLQGWLQSDMMLLRSAIQGVLVLISVGYTTHPDTVEVLSPWYKCRYGR